MKKYSFQLIVVAVAALTMLSCSGEKNVLNNGGDQFNVKYEVRFLSQGAVKITHKDNNGNEITDDPATTFGKENMRSVIGLMRYLMWRRPRSHKQIKSRFN